MNTKTSVNCGAVNTKEDPVRHRRPCRVLRIAIKTHLQKRRNQIKTQQYIPRSELDPWPNEPIHQQKPKTIRKNEENTQKQFRNLVFGFGFELSENGIFVGVIFEGHRKPNRIQWKQKQTIQKSNEKNPRRRRNRARFEFVMFSSPGTEEREREFGCWDFNLGVYFIKILILKRCLWF